MKEVKGARISEETWETFKNLVKAKYGKIHGAFGPELERAMLAWVNSSERTRIRTNSTTLANPKHQRSINTTRDIYHELCKIVPKDHLRVSRKDVEKAIGSVVSHDPRNYRKYVPMLCDLGFLSDLSFGIYGIPERIDVQVRRAGKRIDEKKELARLREKYLEVPK